MFINGVEYYDHLCKCGCGGRIKVRSYHSFKSAKIPTHIQGHVVKPIGSNSTMWKGGQKEASKRFYKINKKKINDYSRKWQSENKEKHLKYRKLYYKHNRDYFLDLAIKRRIKKGDILRLQNKEYYINNKKKIQAYDFYRRRGISLVSHKDRDILENLFFSYLEALEVTNNITKKEIKNVKS